jgi:hypothetical protein
MLSPNIDLYDPKSIIADPAMGITIRPKNSRGKLLFLGSSPGSSTILVSTYRIEGLITLKSVITQTMMPLRLKL